MAAIELDVYIDFLCPWAYRGAIWLEHVERAGRIRPRWRMFSLTENHRRREGVDPIPVWDKNPQAKGLPAFRAAIAAQEQGEDAYSRFRLALQKARHQDGLQVDAAATHRLVAEGAGLDIARWASDLEGADFSKLARDHSEAVRKGVFGVPTLVWPEGRSYYLKINDLIPAERAVALYDAVESIHRFAEVIEVKTPESEGTLAA